MSAMTRVRSVNMPFASVHAPALALARLPSVLRRRLGDSADGDNPYLNFDVVECLGGIEAHLGAAAWCAGVEGAGSTDAAESPRRVKEAVVRDTSRRDVSCGWIWTRTPR
jgi:hypothetical protein